MSSVSLKLKIDAKPFFPSQMISLKDAVMNQFLQWGFQKKDHRLVDEILSEWFTAGTLENILTQWESIAPQEVEKEEIPLNILCYNVQRWGSRSLEVIDIVYKTDASICVFTEVGELWNTSRIPHFNIFHEYGTNKSGGVCVAIGKHLRGSRIKCSTKNTVIVDVNGLSAPIRIIAIYWPAGQTTVLEELEPYIIENTIMTADFNASIKEWGSESVDKRGRGLKEWVEKKIFVTYRPQCILQNVRIGTLIYRLQTEGKLEERL